MKSFVLLLIIAPFCIAGPAGPTRRIFPEERDPNLKRYIHVENEQGEYEMIDLLQEEIAPRIDVSDVEYYLYTSKNKASPFLITNNAAQKLGDSYFDAKKKTMFVVHGWNNNRNSAVNTLILEAVFAGNHDINLIIVDWSGPANSLYLTAKNSVVAIGQIVGQFINSIQESYGIDGSSFVLVGHSLGAHVVGSAGATTTKKPVHIIGLDPAGPLFSLDRPNERLDDTDGEIVQVIHTNGNLLGFASSIGDVDYFPNGGMSQPGCGWDLAGTCAHSKAYKYLAEAITRGDVFEATLCSSYNDYEKELCRNNEQSVMGKLQKPTCTLGDYYLTTNADEPFGQ